MFNWLIFMLIVGDIDAKQFEGSILLCAVNIILHHENHCSYEKLIDQLIE
jgi:hypothetical protein